MIINSDKEYWSNSIKESVMIMHQDCAVHVSHFLKDNEDWWRVSRQHNSWPVAVVGEISHKDWVIGLRLP